MSKNTLFNILFMPIAWLPLPLLYLIADLLAPILNHIVRYRRHTIDANLRLSFPNLDDRQRNKIIHDYYRQLADLLAEAVYNLRSTPAQIKQRYKIANRQLIDRYYEQGQSVILMSAHYHNWEFMVVGLGMLFLHHGIGVGKPLNNKGFGRWLTAKRTRFGTQVVDQTDVRDAFDYYSRHRVPCVYLMLGDQSPSNTHKCYWTTFLNQETGFLFGSEYFARKYNYPVIYYEVKKVKRGHYEIELQELCPDPASAPPYSITQSYISRLEALLTKAPTPWLWSHKRWKRKRPPEEPLHPRQKQNNDHTTNKPTNSPLQ